MEGFKISKLKLQNLKEKFTYFNHHQEKRSFEEVDWNEIPQEYRFFMNNDKNQQTLSFYNSSYAFFSSKL